MNSQPSLERHLERVEERVERLERLQEDAQRLEKRRRRQEFWTRVTLGLVVGIAYVIYLRHVAEIA